MALGKYQDWYANTPRYSVCDLPLLGDLLSVCRRCDHLLVSLCRLGFVALYVLFIATESFHTHHINSQFMSDEKSDGGSPEAFRDETDTSWESAGSFNFEPHLILSKDDEDEEETSIPRRCPWSARNSFTADSPYFKAFCDSEVGSLSLLTDTMRDITSRTRTFAKTGVLMSEAARRLAVSCKLRQDSYEETELPVREQERMAAMRRNAVGEEMANMFGQLGEVRDFLARWESIFFRVLKACLIFFLLDYFATHLGARRNGGSSTCHGTVRRNYPRQIS